MPVINQSLLVDPSGNTDRLIPGYSELIKGQRGLTFQNSSGQETILETEKDVDLRIEQKAKIVRRKLADGIKKMVVFKQEERFQARSPEEKIKDAEDKRRNPQLKKLVAVLKKTEEDKNYRSSATKSPRTRKQQLSPNSMINKAQLQTINNESGDIFSNFSLKEAQTVIPITRQQTNLFNSLATPLRTAAQEPSQGVLLMPDGFETFGSLASMIEQKNSQSFIRNSSKSPFKVVDALGTPQSHLRSRSIPIQEPQRELTKAEALYLRAKNMKFRTDLDNDDEEDLSDEGEIEKEREIKFRLREEREDIKTTSTALNYIIQHIDQVRSKIDVKSMVGKEKLDIESFREKQNALRHEMS